MAQAYIASFMCPHCNTICSFSGKGVGTCAALYCRGCHKGVFFQFRSVDLQDIEVTARISVDHVVDHYPRTSFTVDSSIPENIADDFKEANMCLGVEAKKATVTMCRRVLQNTCIIKGATPNAELYKQINEIESKMIINPTMKEVAHAIRKIGNWGAHPQNDPLKDVTIDDASEIVKFTSEFLEEVFVRPSRLIALKTKKKIK